MSVNLSGMKTSRKYPVRNICGSWKSNLHSPPVEIYHDSKHYCLALIYHPDMVVTNRIRQTDKGLFVDLFGEIQIGYDEERDILYLSTEGEYIRTEEW
ncbi:DUF3876 domain-containing protein [Bacteroides hominis]|nr:MULTISPECIES: DUF3876 domain-containing protein [Bacteroides]MCS2422324.1 DUF3876 domain-containing protein [Bacteroides fragilis]MCS2660778.1 DUF3876 domain-containing protein [Bacteroides fragilis]MCS2779175.1 DUF3876 domain-containing protein [Bacteroides fragilis]MCZ2543011.1 DUF3876 domain-containing protein [Bacteroides fragilis]MDA1471945.1 DUF3876 domain-containing protein [Bacteroides fragilis]